MLIRTPSDAIRHQRRLRGLDQQGLASRIGVSRQWVTDDKGKPRAEIGLALRVLHALGIALSMTNTHGAAEGKATTGVSIDDIVEQAREPDP